MTVFAETGITTLLIVVGTFGLLIGVAIYVWYAVALSRLFPRLDGEGWKGWVPVLNEAEILARGGVPAWSVVFYFIPIVQFYGLYLKVVATHRINQRFGRGAGMTVLAILLPPVWATVLAWGAPPYPEGDRLEALQPGPHRSAQPAAAPPRDASGYTIPSLAPPAVAPAAPPALDVPDYAPPQPPAVQPQNHLPAAQPQAYPPVAQSPSSGAPERSFAPPATQPPPPQPPAPHAPAPQPVPPAAPEPSVPVPPSAFEQGPVEQPARAVRPVPPAFRETETPDAEPQMPTIRPAPDLVLPPKPVLPPEPALAPDPVSDLGLVLAPDPAPEPVPAADPAPAGGLPADVDKTVVTPRPVEDDLDATVVVARRRGVRRVLVLDDGRKFALSGASVVIGRNPVGEPGEQCLAVSDATRTLSKTHARLVVMEDEWRLTDLNATNGVVVVEGDGTETLLDPGESVVGTGRFILGEVGMQVVAERDS